MRQHGVIEDARRRTVALLHDVASDPRFALRADELQALADAVRLGGPAEAGWRGLDLHGVFAADTTLRLRPRRRRRLAGLLAVLAALVLVAAVVQVSATFLGGSLLVLLGARVLSWSADRVDREDEDRGAARLARAMTAAATTMNARSVRDPLEGVDVLTEATGEFLRVQQAARESLQVLHSATQRLAETSELLAHGTNAVGKSLGLHTGALQHQISELTQVRASLERLSGLALDDAPPATNP